MNFSMTFLAYLGPETMLPMTSVVAGLAGVIMLFGRNTLRVALGMGRRLVAVFRAKQKPRARTRKIGQGPVTRIGSLEKDRVRA